MLGAALSRSGMGTGGECDGEGTRRATTDSAGAGKTNLRESALGEDTIDSRSAWGGRQATTESSGSYMRRQVFPHAPSPTITSLRRISAIVESDQQRVCKAMGKVSRLARC